MADTYLAGTPATKDSVIAAIKREPVQRFDTLMDANFLARHPMFARANANGLWNPQAAGVDTIVWRSDGTRAVEFNLDVAISAVDQTTLTLSPIGAVEPNMVLSWRSTAGVAETARVVSVGATTCEVSRALTGSAADAVAQNVTIPCIGTIPLENAAASAGVTVYGPSYTNYMHWMEKTVDSGDRARAQWSWSPENDLVHQVNLALQQMQKELAFACWRSVKTASGADYRTMDGFRAQIATYTLNGSSAAILFSHLNTLIGYVYDQGVTPDTIWVSPTTFEGMTVWGATSKLQANMPSDVAGQVVHLFRSARAGDIPIRPDNTLWDDEIVVGNSSYMHAGWLNVLDNTFSNGMQGMSQPAGLRIEAMDRSGPYVRAQILGGFCCQLRDERAFARGYSFSGVDSDGV